jgi:hypothetical protein
MKPQAVATAVLFTLPPRLGSFVPEALDVLFEPAIVLAADLLERVQAHCCFPWGSQGVGRSRDF